MFLRGRILYYEEEGICISTVKRRRRLSRNPIDSAGSCARWKGAGVRGGDGAEYLASACVVEVDLVGLLESGELGAGFCDGEGLGHGCVWRWRYDLEP